MSSSTPGPVEIDWATFVEMRDQIVGKNIRFCPTADKREVQAKILEVLVDPHKFAFRLGDQARKENNTWLKLHGIARTDVLSGNKDTRRLFSTPGHGITILPLYKTFLSPCYILLRQEDCLDFDSL